MHYKLVEAIIAILMTLSIFAGNAFAKKGKNKMILKTEVASVSIKYTIRKVSNKKMKIDYKIVNNRENDIYFANRIFDFDEHGFTDLSPTLAYVKKISGDNLRIGKYIPRIPENSCFYSPEIPYFDKLQPGKSAKGVIELKIPIPLNAPYMLVIPHRSPKERPFKGIEVSIGILDSSKFEPRLTHVSPAEGKAKGAYCGYYYENIDIQEMLTVKLDGVNLNYLDRDSYWDEIKMKRSE